MVFMQSEGFEKEVFLFQDIEDINGENLAFSSGIFLLKSPRAFLGKIKHELYSKSFRDFYLFFLSELAEDELRSISGMDG